MAKLSYKVTWLVFAFALSLVLLSACNSGPKSYQDPFDYCKAVGNIDAPDTRYTGPKVPEAVVKGLQKAFNMPADAPLPPFMENSSWRCMDGQVYACTVGANLPCGEKADTSRTASAPVVEFCKANPSADVVPMAVTGRATVYEWRCTSGAPEIVKQFTEADARGFIASVWHKIDK